MRACVRPACSQRHGRGALVSLEHFAHWEANTRGQQGVPSDVEHIINDMLALGVHPESVHGVLHSLEIPTHFYVSRPVNNAQGVLGLDPRQARLLDSLPTDRLLLQADNYEGNSAVSHYVAFRRDGDQWVLLDSLRDAPQYGVAPSDYLLRDEGHRSFTAIWPENALQDQNTDVDIEDMLSELFETGDEAAHGDGGVQDSQSPALPVQAQAVDAVQEAHGMSADPGSKQPTGGLPYSFMHAESHWNYSKRAEEFEPLRQALENATGKAVSGAALLQLLSQACDKVKPENRKLIAELNEKKIKGMICEFEVQIHPGVDVVHVWRGAYDNGHIDLRRALKTDNIKAKACMDLLKEMKRSANVSAGRRSKQLTPYSAKDAWHHWNDNEQRAEEFEPLRQAWQEATGKSDKQASGPAFLRHLSAECDKAEEGGKLIEDLGKNGKIFEFEVQTYEGATQKCVWRGVDGNGSINLRLAPKPEENNTEEDNIEAREKLRDEMKKSMEKISVSASLRIEQLPGGLIYSYRDAQNHWKRNKKRAEKFEPLRQALEKVMGKAVSGATFLQLLSQKCDEAKPEDYKLVEELVKGSIFEFKVRMHPEMEDMHVWRGISNDGHIDLRLALEKDIIKGELLNDMLQCARNSGTHRSKQPTRNHFHFTLNANRHWDGRRAEELESLRQAWQKATGKSDKQASGPAFLRHLSAECDKAGEKAKLLYDFGKNAKIFEFEVQTHPEGKEERLWCWIDDSNCITNLRKAPKKDDIKAHEKLLAEMKAVARGVASRLGIAKGI